MCRVLTDSLTHLWFIASVYLKSPRDVTLLKVLEFDRQLLEDAKDELNDLDWRVAAVWVDSEPLLENSAT